MSTVATPSDSTRFNLSRWALQQKPLVLFFMLVTIAAGVWSYQRLSRNEDPPFTIKTMVVSAFWPGANTSDTASLLTDKIEKKLEETPFLDRLESYSRSGESVIFVHLRDDTPPKEVQRVWYQVRKKVKDIEATLPQGTQGPFYDDEFGDTYGMIFGFTAEGFTQRELRDRVDDVRDRILRTPDIGKVNLLGVQEEQILISFSPARLAAYGIAPDDVTQAIIAQNAVQPAGVIRTAQDKIAIRVDGAFLSETSLKDLVLRINDRDIRLPDLAAISRIPQDPAAPLFRVNGQEAIGLAISMSATGNLLKFGETVRGEMNRIAAELPHGIEITTVADQSTVVDDAVHGFMKVLLEAIAIVLIVSFISLGFRAGLVVSLSIPLVLAMTFVFMDIMGIGLQRISLGALIIALGLLVDDAMITVEAMVSRLEIGWRKEKAAVFAYESTAFPMLTGTLVMIAGFVPVGFAASGAGEYCYSLFVVVLISLLASWVVAVLFAPLIGVWVLPDRFAHAEHKEGRLLAAYRRLLDKVLLHPVRTIVVSVLVLAVSIGGTFFFQHQFFPASDRPELLVNLTLPQNASRSATEADAKRVEALLKGDAEIEKYSAYVGAGAIRFYLPMDLLLNNDNVAQFVVITKDLHARDRVRDRLEAALSHDFPEVTTRVMPLELGPPVGWPLKYRVTGPDPARVRELAQQVAGIVSSNANARAVNLTAGEPQRVLKLKVHQSEAHALGLSSQDVAGALATLVAGQPVTALRDGKRTLDVVLRADEAERNEPAAIADLQIGTRGGQPISLRQIATPEYGVEDPIQWKRQRQPMITVQADVARHAQPATVAAQLAGQITEFRAKLPSGYAIQEGGAVEESAKGSRSIQAVMPVTVLLMITLLMLQLRDFKRMALAVAMAPFGIIGVVAAMVPFGIPMGFVAQLGVISLAGMIIRNAVILIQEADENVRRGEAPLQAVINAAIHRCRPILLTACAAILGMIPISHQVFWGPMAYAIIGGLTGGTVLTLTLLPAVLRLLLAREATVTADAQLMAAAA